MSWARISLKFSREATGLILSSSHIDRRRRHNLHLPAGLNLNLSSTISTSTFPEQSQFIFSIPFSVMSGYPITQFRYPSPANLRLISSPNSALSGSSQAIHDLEVDVITG